jgi:hypothetical protein
MTVNVTDTVGANNTIVLDSNSKIPAIDGSQVTALSATAFTTGTLATARIDVGTTAGKILQLDSNAKIPAISGANLTNAPGPTISASDPTISTNPTLGAKWVNKTSAEIYICTDATTDANVWTNVGAGTGDIQPWQYAGSLYGYASGGWYPPNNYSNMIQRWSFTSDGNAVDTTQNLTRTVIYCSPTGSSSSTHGYNAGGYNGGTINVIDKYAFNTTANATDVGDLSTGRQSGAQCNSETYGYIAGGSGVPYTNGTEKWAFATDGNATAVGSLGPSATATPGAGAASATHGYYAGPYTGGGSNFIIEKYSFSVDGNSTDVGDLTARGMAAYPGGASSTTHGYIAGGNAGGAPNVNVIDRWSFAIDGNAADVGDLSVGKGNAGGSSSITHGYVFGDAGRSIDKWSYAASANGTDVGDLVNESGTERAYCCGNQY